MGTVDGEEVGKLDYLELRYKIREYMQRKGVLQAMKDITAIIHVALMEVEHGEGKISCAEIPVSSVSQGAE